jgi:uncharacterized protein
MGELTCPKCHGAMRSYERVGVTVDQCSECRGIFLDRAELERLLDAESSHSSRPVAAVPDRDHPEKRMEEDHRYEPRYDDRRYEPRYDDRYRNDHYKKKKRKSFFEELFD